jgi:putative hydrolase of the HAD superfamily
VYKNYGVREKQKKYKAVFFDAGNTLLRPSPSVHEVCSEIFVRNGHEIHINDMHRAIELGDKYYEERYWADDTFWRSESESRAMWVDLYELVANELGINDDCRKLAVEIYDEFGSHHRWELFADVEPVLEELKRRGLKLGIVSNWDTRLTKICFGMGLSDYFDFIISSAAVGRFKPDPDIFNMALRRAGVLAEDVIHVGDHYYADVIGARVVGATPVLIDRAEKDSSLDCIRISDMSMLLEIFDNDL